MSRKLSVSFSEEMYYTSKSAIVLGQIFGLFPIKIERNSKEVKLKWSKSLAIYSYSFGLVVVFLAYKGVLNDIMADRNKSIRIRADTDIFVDFSDVSAVIMVLISGIFITPFNYSYFWEYVEHLNKIDGIIPRDDLKSSKTISMYVMSSLLVIIFAMALLDTSMYIDTAGERAGISFILLTYTPLYIGYHVLLIHDGLMWHLGYCIFRRIKVLNKCLCSEFINRNVRKMPTLKCERIILCAEAKRVKIVRKEKENVSILELTIVYERLCDATESLNKLLGISRTITVLGMLWSLIVIPYLLIVEVAGKRKNVLYITAYSLWFLLHLGRLFLLAQPCYICSNESKITNSLVSNLLSSSQLSQQCKLHLTRFSLLTLHRKFDFTACGLTTLNRSLITSLLGSVATYLVIMLQFSNAEELDILDTTEPPTT